MLFNKPADKLRHLFKKDSIFFLEGGGSVTVDVDFTDNPPACVDWHHNLRSGLDGTGQVAGIGVDIIDDDSLAVLYCRSTNTFTDWDSHMGGWIANERSNDQHLSVSRIEHIETHPVEVSETPRHALYDASFQTLKRFLKSLQGSEFIKKGGSVD